MSFTVPEIVPVVTCAQVIPADKNTSSAMIVELLRFSIGNSSEFRPRENLEGLQGIRLEARSAPKPL
jgi:hypothetical protein